MSITVNNGSLVKGLALRLDLVLKGLQTAMPAGVKSLTVGKVTYTIADLVKLVKETEQPRKDARAAHAVIRGVMQNRRKDAQAALDLLGNLKIALATILGRDGQELLQFGFAPAKRRAPLTSEQKVLRAAKAKQTREKRHTRGSRQKAQLGPTATPSVSISPDGKIAITPALVNPGTPTTTKAAV